MSRAKNIKPRVFGTGLIALDLFRNASSDHPIQSWAGGTCGNVLSILAFLGWDSYPIARMNGDPASGRIKADMNRWGVKLDFTDCEPTCNPPIIIHEIRHGRNGLPTHRFLWECPQCGKWLPRFRAVTREAVDEVGKRITEAQVFFMDRVSRAALTLAAHASEAGAIVMFEPSGRSDPKLFSEAMQLAHIVKYSDQRLSEASGALSGGSANVVEVQTMGAEGLRFRHRLNNTLTKWANLPALRAPQFLDNCGSGDWCSAGLLSKVATGGLAELKTQCHGDLVDALRYGQALAAWNCAFEGARGGMYAVRRDRFDDQINRILDGGFDGPIPAPKKSIGKAINCPACPA